MAGNANLRAARVAKSDEFYTQWSDIEHEMQAYLEYNPGVFRGKTVLLPCDDPEWSNFTRFFVHNFTAFGMKKLISTSYTPRGNGRIFAMGSGSKSDGCIEWDHLDGDGDFRSDEVTALRDEADMVITNPPYSLFREFIAWLIEGNVEFAAIGNMNAAACKEVFPHIKEDRLWRGATPDNGRIKWFRIPDDAPVKSSVQRTDPDGARWQDVGNSVWFTNIEHGRRHEPLELMTMEDNLRFSRRKIIRELGYQKYDNFDAIEVPFTEAIPSDYEGLMGVPISFLDRYNPAQFEIVGTSDGAFAASLGVKPLGSEYKGNVGRTKLGLASTRKAVFRRILIRHRNPECKESQPLSRPRGGQSSLRCKRGFSHVEVRG